MNAGYDQAAADRMLADLVANPSAFKEQGRTLHLLEQFFRGLPLIHLHRLFLVTDRAVLQVAIWLASELAEGVEQFLDEAITLHDHPDTWIRYFSDNVIVRATASVRHAEFSRVLEHLEDDDRRISGAALRYFVNATPQQLLTALEHFKKLHTASAPIHVAALREALSPAIADLGAVERMAESEVRLQSMYGAGIAIRRANDEPRASEILDVIHDTDVSRAVERILRIRAAASAR